MNNSLAIVSRRERVRAAVWKAVALAWAALIFYLSTGTFGGSLTATLLSQILGFLRLAVSLATFDTLHHLMRKSAHVTEYAIFAMLLYGSAEDARPFDWRPRRALLSVAIAGVYSLTDEFHQRFVPGRGPSLVDCGIDTMGGILGVLLFYMRGWFSRARRGSGAAAEATRSGSRM